MNPLHYPDLELCKKLTEAGFPEETSCHFRKNNSDMYEYTFGPWNDESYVCPSVMELLDEMPGSIPDGRNRAFSIWTLVMGKFGGFWGVQYGEGVEEGQTKKYCESKESLPNALAEMWLWLKENKFISTH